MGSMIDPMIIRVFSAEEQMCVRAYIKHERKKQKKRKQKKQKKRTKLPIVRIDFIIENILFLKRNAITTSG